MQSSTERDLSPPRVLPALPVHTAAILPHRNLSADQSPSLLRFLRGEAPRSRGIPGPRKPRIIHVCCGQPLFWGELFHAEIDHRGCLPGPSPPAPSRSPLLPATSQPRWCSRGFSGHTHFCLGISAPMSRPPARRAQACAGPASSRPSWPQHKCHLAVACSDLPTWGAQPPPPPQHRALFKCSFWLFSFTCICLCGEVPLSPRM